MNSLSLSPSLSLSLTHTHTRTHTQDNREHGELQLFFNRIHEEEAAKRSTARRVSNIPTSTRTKIIVDSHKAQVIFDISFCVQLLAVSVIFQILLTPKS